MPDEIKQILFNVIQTDLFKIGIVLLLYVILHKIVKGVFKRLFPTEPIHIKYLKHILQGMLVITVLMVLGSFFEPVKEFSSVILASSGLLVAVLGFAAQESLANIINGLFISIFKPFEIGDRVTLQNQAITGVIEDITLRHTVIKKFSHSRVIVPNSVMNKEIIENSNFNDCTAGNFLDVCITYESNIDLAMTIMCDCIAQHPLFVDTRTEEEVKNGADKVTVLVRDLAVNGVALRSTVITEDVNLNFRACSELRLAIKEQFEAQGIEIAYPHLQLVEANKAYIN